MAAAYNLTGKKYCKTMNIAEKKQRRLRHLIDAPKRFLRRARDLYVDSLVSIDSKVGSANIVSINAGHNLPKNYGRCSSSGEENLDEQMYRSICNRYGVELDRGAGSLRERGGIDRSYSIALGKMGTIDEEDEACEFEEKSDILFLRSRSHAVTRSYAFH